MQSFTEQFHDIIVDENHIRLLNIIRDDAEKYQETIGIKITYDLETLLSVLTDLSGTTCQKAISAPTASFLINEDYPLQESLKEFSEDSKEILKTLRSFIFEKCMKPIRIGKERGTYSFLDQFYGPLLTAINGVGLDNPQNTIKEIFTTNWDICFKTWS